MDQTQSGRLLFGAVALVVVPLAVWVVRSGPFVSLIPWMLALPAMALTVIGVLFEHEGLLPLSATREAALYSYAPASRISYMLHDQEGPSYGRSARGAT